MIIGTIAVAAVIFVTMAAVIHIQRKSKAGDQKSIERKEESREKKRKRSNIQNLIARSTSPYAELG